MENQSKTTEQKLKDLRVYGIYLLDELAEKFDATNIEQISPLLLQGGATDITTTMIKEWSDYDSILVLGLNVKGDDNDQ